MLYTEKELQDNIEKDLIIISKWLSVLDSIRQAIKLGNAGKSHMLKTYWQSME